jgi:Ca-activated chloride channel family protein
MQRRFALLGFIIAALSVCSFCQMTRPNAAAPDKITQGALTLIGKENAACPLKHTAVKAQVSGPLVRVTVTQEFTNPLGETIEAVYVFPLSQRAAVDDMTMHLGERVIRGQIKKREEARAIYEAARAKGQIASLLDQERPNIFTQAVANILPGASIKVVISYVETLKYEDGSYEFSFPMVVAPRYVPGEAIGQQGVGFAPETSEDTSEVPDASRLTPQVAAEGTRAGHDLSLEVALDTGVPLESITSTLHEIETERQNEHAALVRLKDRATIPNRDFILKFDVAGKQVSDALLTHRSQQGGFFTLMFQPPERVTAVDVMPKELVFVLDTSGSMDGFPLEKAKETMRMALAGLYPQDTFNLITFAGETRGLFPAPVAATAENVQKAQAFLESQEGGGRTEMMRAIRAALGAGHQPDHVRIVCFMTDGEVGNDFAIINEVRRHPYARVFSFGIGHSVNRFLLDKMAEHGRGEVEYVSLSDDGSAAAKRFHERIRNPLFTDLKVDWGGLAIADVYPQRLPDLFSAKPLVLTGRYTRPGRGVIRVTGQMSGREVTRELAVELPAQEARHDVLATLWARQRIDDLMSDDFEGIQNGHPRAAIKHAITQLGLEYRLMTQFTSFVAVEEMRVTHGGKVRRVAVPVELPEGMKRESVFGSKDEEKIAMSAIVKPQSVRMHSVSGRHLAYGNGVPGGVPGGVVGGVAGGMGDAPPPPTPPPAKPQQLQQILGLHERDIASSYVKPINVSGGVLQTSAVKKVQPAYPSLARAANAKGTVVVQVTIDEAGQVVATNTLSGHPLFRQAALDAAKQWQFKPTMLSGKPVQTTGVLTFNFDTVGKATPVAAPEAWRGKLSAALAAFVTRWPAANGPLTADEAKFVSHGQATVRVTLANKRLATLAQLQSLGFVVTRNAAKTNFIVGRVPVERLTELAALPVVRYVTPQR